ncbi:MAG: ABC transporter substrate-binding protein [Clostridia bacterium]|nr:ABC transporter substrate-binding protein [Clostridia bacterium]
MKKIISLILVMLLAMGLMACTAGAEKTPVRVASLKGPTSMGLVQLMHAEETANDYTFTVEATADAITPLLIRGELDIALVPANLASVLYNKTEGGVQVAAINTLGVLYVIETGETVSSVADLKGKTIYSTGQGTTPEFALNYVLAGNGLDPKSDVNVEFKTEATEVASAMLQAENAVAVLPQPFVTSVLMQNENARVALSLTEEWDKIGDGSAMVTGVALVRTAFAQENPEAVQAFLTEYAASTAFTNENAAQAAEWIVELEIVGKAQIAEKAIPNCNIVCITGEEMQAKLSGYLTALHGQDPAAVGGNLPGEDFYLVY